MAEDLIDLFKNWMPTMDDGLHHQPDDSVILKAGGKDRITRWWVSQAPNRDAYDVYVARYHRDFESQKWSAEFLQPSGTWLASQDGSMGTPVWTLPGDAVHTLATEGMFVDPRSIERSLNRVCAELIAEVLIRSGAYPVDEDDEETP